MAQTITAARGAFAGRSSSLGEQRRAALVSAPVTTSIHTKRAGRAGAVKSVAAVKIDFDTKVRLAALNL